MKTFEQFQGHNEQFWIFREHNWTQFVMLFTKNSCLSVGNTFIESFNDSLRFYESDSTLRLQERQLQIFPPWLKCVQGKFKTVHCVLWIAQKFSFCLIKPLHRLAWIMLKSGSQYSVFQAHFETNRSQYVWSIRFHSH